MELILGWSLFIGLPIILVVCVSYVFQQAFKELKAYEHEMREYYRELKARREL